MRFSSTDFRAAALIAAVACSGGAALAQTTPAAPPAAGQAAPAPGQPQPQPAPQGPVKVDLQPAPPDWIKMCGRMTPDPKSKEVCFTQRNFSTDPQQAPPIVAFAIYDIKGEDSMVRFMLPTAFLLKPGIRFAVDKQPMQEGQYTICWPTGFCFAEAKVKANFADVMKKGTTITLIAKNQAQNEVTFTLPLAGFGKVFDGAPIDPKVLQEQEQQVQQDLQRQLEERARQQRQSLEQGGQGAAPAAGQAPAAPAPAK